MTWLMEVWNIRTRGTVSDKILLDKAFNIAKTPNNDGYQKGLALLVCKFCGKKFSGRAIKHEDMSDKELAEELQKTIIRKFQKQNVHSS